MIDISSYFTISRTRSGFMLDEDRLVYLSDESGVDQLYVKSISDKSVRCITNFENRVWTLSSSHNGPWVYFTSDEGGDEQEQIFTANIDTGEVRNITQNPAARFGFGGVLPGGTHLVACSTARNPANFDVVKIDIATGESTMVVQNTENYNLPAALSPNGRWFLFNKMQGISNNPLWMVDMQANTAEKVHEDGDFAQYQSPCWKSDSSGFYMATDFDSDFTYVAWYSLADKKISKIYQPDWDVDGLALSPDDRYLAVLVNEEGYSRLQVLDLVLGGFANIPTPPAGLIMPFWGCSFADEGHRFLFTHMSVKRPGNVWMLDMDADSLQCLTPTVWNELSADDLLEPELHRFDSFDGLSVPYWLYRKPGTPLGAPVVFQIHGGPEGQEYPIYNGLLAYLVNEGFVVVAPNVRGSTGYGKKYHHLDDVEKRLDSIHDVQALAEHLVDEGIAQHGKMAIMGSSYGGYMTLSGITEYPSLFSAAIDTVGISNFETFLENTADYRRSHRESEYGSLADHRDVLRRVSPIHKVKDIVTPLMVVHGANDPRVPVGEAEQIVASLKDRNIEVEFLCYADEGHGLAKLKNKLDCYPKAAAFLKKYLE